MKPKRKNAVYGKYVRHAFEINLISLNKCNNYVRWKHIMLSIHSVHAYASMLSSKWNCLQFAVKCFVRTEIEILTFTWQTAAATATTTTTWCADELSGWVLVVILNGIKISNAVNAHHVHCACAKCISNACEVIKMVNQKSLVRTEWIREWMCINEIVKNQYFLPTLVIAAVTLYIGDCFQQVHIKNSH